MTARSRHGTSDFAAAPIRRSRYPCRALSYVFGTFELDVAAWELRERGQVLPVQPKVLGVLHYLLRHRDRVVSQQELLEAVWAGVSVSSNSVAQAVASIRRLLHEGSDEFVRTVQTRGYRFVASVERSPEDSAPASEREQHPFVGRTAVLEQLWRRLERARSSGDIVLVTGEAGIGKSRTVAELVRRVEDRNQRVLRTRCHEGDGRELAPWRQLLCDDLGHESEPFRLFERVRSWLRERAHGQPPLLVVIEDLNWADTASLLLLKFLAPDIAELELLLVATYRSSPIEPALARVLGAMTRDDPSRRIELEALDLDACKELARRQLGAAIEDELAQHLWRKAAGNPLFFTQLLHVLELNQGRDAAAVLTSALLAPETVRAAISAHLEPLSAPCRDTLRAAAVLGDSFRLEVLAKTLNLAGPALLERLEEASRAGVIKNAAPPDDFRFRQSVLRDVLYRELALTERARLQRALAALGSE